MSWSLSSPNAAQDPCRDAFESQARPLELIGCQRDGCQEDRCQEDGSQQDRCQEDGSQQDRCQEDDCESADDARLMAILEDYLSQLERGEFPDPERIIAAHPDLATPLRSYLASLDFLQQAAGGLRTGPAGGPVDQAGMQAGGPADLAGGPVGKGDPGQPGETAVPETRRLGDYRIVRELGRGGMGVVYEAEQISLGRRVALKVLPLAAVLDPRQLQRFRNEAQAAAALHHPHIVPVYGIGCDRGVHYYAMQFIEGQTLAEAIVCLRGTVPGEELPGGDQDTTSAAGSAHREGALPLPGSPPDSPHESLPGGPLGGPEPAPFAQIGVLPRAQETTARLRDLSTLREASPLEYYRQVARLVIQVADALDHAHLQGVLHRDIKPSNLILDACGKVWVTDFGLARMEANPGVTQTGDLVGTLRYMSPEQLLARRGLVDHRTDVYSLGATLYELLTLQPAFGDMERQELLRRVSFDDPLPPRKICRAIPLELETIVLKAMAKSTVERYATAQAMADDLRKFLEHRPIQARRPNLFQRVSKWSQRHRAVVATAVVSTILGLAASTFVLLYEQHHLQSARREAEANYALARQAALREREERAKAEREQGRAERNLQKAFDAVEQMLTEVATRDLADVPQVEPVRRRLLEKALQFYQELLYQRGHDPGVWAEVARAHHRVGQVQHMLGRNEQARASVERAVDTFSRLSTRQPELLHELSRSLATLGRLNWEAGHHQRARDAIKEALRHQRRVVDAYPDQPRYRFALADIMTNLATLCLETGELRECEETFRQALQVHADLAGEYPDELEYRDQLADNYLNLGVFYRNTGRTQEAERALRQSLQVSQQLVSDHPDKPRLKAGMALSHNNLGALLWNLGAKTEAERHWAQAIDVQEHLVRDHPDRPEYLANLAASYHNRAVLHKETLGCDAAVDQMQSALDVRRKLVRDYPWHTRYRRDLALGLSSLGEVYLEMSRLAEAKQAFVEAWQLQQALTSKHPEILDFAVDLAGSCLSRGRLALELDDYPSALDYYQEAMKISSGVLEKRPQDYRALKYLDAAENGFEELRTRHWDQMAGKA